MWAVLLGIIGWVLAYIIVVKSNKVQSVEAASRILASVHSFIASRSVEWFLLSYPFVFKEFGAPTTTAETSIVTFSISYFIFETVYCLYAQTEDGVMMLHHFVSLSALLWSRCIATSSYEVCLLIWSAEFTNPFLQMGWFLRTDFIWRIRQSLSCRILDMLFSW